MKKLFCSITGLILALPFYASAGSYMNHSSGTKVRSTTSTTVHKAADDMKASAAKTKSKMIERQEEVDNTGTIYPSSESSSSTTTKKVKKGY